MTARARALQYTVDQQGLVHTRGAYSEMRDADMTIEDKLVLLSDSPEQWAVFARSVPV